MQLRDGDMWSVYPEVDLFLITTNSYLKEKNGALVMGRGIAVQAKRKFKGLDLALGKHIKETCGNLGEYGLLVSPRWPAAKLGAFQVKRDFRLRADLDLIAFSTQMLLRWCLNHPDAQVCLNYPGIGNGHLEEEEVYPFVKHLPDTVTLWRYPTQQAEVADASLQDTQS